jgi:hypothetical protein
MPSPGKDITQGSSSSDIDAFLDRARQVGKPTANSRGRLIFALDATLSRQPTWDIAQSLQGRMFDAAAGLGGLDVQLVYFRGLNECRASRFVTNGDGLAALMSKIDVRGGETQIGKVLNHTMAEAKVEKVGALVFVGDAVEENADELCAQAGEVSLLGVKAFMFHEGHDPDAASCFREISRITGGAYATFDAAAPKRLAGLLAAAAAYAAGGRAALEKQAVEGGDAAKLLLTQMR